MAMTKDRSKMQWLFIGAATIGMVSCIATEQAAKDERAAAAAAIEAQKTPEQRIAEAAYAAMQKSEFERVLAGARALKQQSKNPAAFKLTDAMVTNAGAACYEYSGTNSFNAVVPGFVVEVGGKFLQTTAAWNKHCADKANRNYQHASAQL